jgi:energy-converting hydrogenase Eha subunit A
MDRVHLAYDLVRAYVYALVLSAVVTALWLASPEIAERPRVASIWSAVAGFGTIVLLTFGITHLTRS